MQWRASHILVKDPTLVPKILQELKEGTDFRALAKRYSTCPSKKKGGDLGWFGPRKMVRPFENAVKRLGLNKVSEAVRTEFGFHIIKKTGQK